MSISPSSLQVLSSLSLIPSSMVQSLGNSTPAQLNQLASLTSQLSEEETLFGQPSTTGSSSTSPNLSDSVALSNATLSSLGVAPATTTTPATPIATAGISVLG